MSSDIILSTDGLTKRFKGLLAVDNVSLRVKRGSIHALIGPNGAGKTTCFNLLTRFLPATQGQIKFNNRDITATPPADVANMGLARSFQISSVFLKSSVLENVRIALQRKRGSSFDFLRSDLILHKYNADAEALLELVGLERMTNALAGSLSYGRRRALEIATTLALQPEMLLLDEPMAGMGQEDIERISALIKQVSANRTILIVEHNLPVVASLSDHVTVLARGSVLAEGDYSSIANNPLVIEAYIGAGHA